MLKEMIEGLINAPPAIQDFTVGVNTFKIRKLNGLERSSWEAYVEDKKEKVNFLSAATIAPSALVAMCLCEEDGKSIYTVADAEHIGKLPSDVLEQLWTACRKMNRIGPDEAAALKGESSATTN